MDLNHDNVTAFIETHQPELYRLAYSLLRDASLAERAAQEALLAALRSGRGQKLPLDQWLARRVVDACRRRAKLAELRDWVNNLVEQLRSAEDGPAEAGASTYATSGIWPTFERLNSEDRLVLVLHYFHGYPVEKMAVLLRTGEPAVRSKLRAARERMDSAVGGPSALLGEFNAGGINHTQARHLIQSAADLPLSGPPWLSLQAHLESCPACRAYRERVRILTRELGRALHAQLTPPASSGPEATQRVLALWETTRRKTRTLSLFTLGLALGIGIFLLSRISGQATAPQSSLFDPPPSATPLPTLTFTPQAITATLDLPGEEVFRTPLLFESERDGNPDIYLLIPNPAASGEGELTNLTEHPADDRAPVWSPDGEWIAFLSDRSGKNEVYVLHISGSPLIQLTHAPEIDWFPPLSWAPDGQRIALAGRLADDEGRPWLYLAPTQGGDLVRLSNTRRARNPLWDESGEWLAFEQLVEGRNLTLARRVSTGDQINLTDLRSFGSGILLGASGSFAWAPDRQGILHVIEGPFISARRGSTSNLRPADGFTSRLILTVGIGERAGFTGDTYLDELPDDVRVRSVSRSPAGLTAMLLQVISAHAARQDCYALRLISPNGIIYFDTNLDRFCAVGTFGHQPWSPDGRWLVLQGNTPDDPATRLYAFDLAPLIADEEDSGARLVALSKPDEQAQLLQVRPQNAVLGIRPAAVDPSSTASSAPPPVDLAQAPGWLYLADDGGGQADIFAMRPDGSQRRNLSNHLAEDSMPAISPDGRWLAFYTGRENWVVNRVSLYGVQLEEASQHALIYGSQVSTNQWPLTSLPFVPPFIGSPVWSPPDVSIQASLAECAACSSERPNGYRLAVLANAGQEILLYVRSVTEEFREAFDVRSRAQFTGRGALTLGWSDFTIPQFTPDGQSLLLADKAMGSSRLMRAHVPADGQPSRDWRLDTLWTAENETTITDLALSPNGQQVAILTTRLLTPNSRLDLYLFDLESGEARRIHQANVQENELTLNGSFSRVDWLADEQLLLHLPGLPDERYKTRWILIDTKSGTQQQLAQIEDQVRNHWLSPDRRWMLYLSDTGLWAFEFDSLLANRASPAQILTEIPTWIVGSIGWGP